MGYVGSFRITVAIMSAIAVICMLVPVFTIKEKDYASTEPSSTPVLESLKKTFSNKQFRIFALSDILYWVALTIFQTGLPFYITSLMGLEDNKTFTLFAVMTGMSLVFYAPVNIFAKKLGKKKLVFSAFVFFSLVFLLTTLCGKMGISGMANGILIAVLASIPMAVLGILPQAIVADIAQADGIETGESREGMFFAARTFAMKLGQSVAMLLFTSMAKIGSEDGTGSGYRISAAVAAVFCLGGAIALGMYKENKIKETIDNSAKENTNETA